MRRFCGGLFDRGDLWVDFGGAVDARFGVNGIGLIYELKVCVCMGFASNFVVDFVIFFSIFSR